MNSEELEISLRTEFESYLKGVFAEMRQEMSQFQEKIDAELERHKSELDGVFSNVLSRVETTQELDAGFKDSVIEHLRLAKDEGARITATAIAQAEEMEKESAPSTGVKEIYEAVADISSKQSQSEILKSLVQHAGQFAARGAFFIIKNDHLVGWRVVGNENTLTDDKLREVFLPLSSDSVLSDSVRSLETVKSPSKSYNDDAEIFDRIELNDAHQMVATPLIARGRGVAVLYADSGANNPNFNAEALETLVRVAGLTVEVLASSKGSAPAKKPFAAQETSVPEQNVATGFEAAPIAAEQQYQAEVEPTGAESYESPTAESYEYSEPAVETSAEIDREEVSHELPTETQPFYDPAPSIAPSVQEDEPVEAVENAAPEVTADDYVPESYPTNEYQFESSTSAETYQPVETQFDVVEPETPQDTEETIQPTEEKYSDYSSSEWSQTADTHEYSAQQYAENFAKETDPTEYAKEYSYQPEELKTEGSKDFSYQPSGETTEAFAEPASNYSYETPVEPVNDYQYEAPKTESFNSYETSQTESYNPTVETFTPTPEQTYGTFEPQAEPQSESYQSYEPVVSQPVQQEAPKTRLSERNVDLPIEVSEDERRLHNDARRFARLLVSEIKLYNEQKVKEGRESGDLYDRLREAIDRSREMYDKRVQPPVAAKFDYFHYELVNTLAEGNDNKLGAGYPGSSVQ